MTYQEEIKALKEDVCELEKRERLLIGETEDAMDDRDALKWELAAALEASEEANKMFEDFLDVGRGIRTFEEVMEYWKDGIG